MSFSSYIRRARLLAEAASEVIKDVEAVVAPRKPKAKRKPAVKPAPAK